MKVLKTLAVGVGGRGLWPLRACRPELGFEVVALCDIDPDALSEARDITGLSKAACYGDYARALDGSVVDCVIVCTPTVHHVPMAKKAVERGLPVLTEKGMAPDWASACEVVSFVKAHDGIFCVSQNYRYNAGERTVQRVLTDATDPAYLGRPFLLDYTHHRVRPHPRTLTYPFASVWDMSCHHFDNLLCWFGPVGEMTAHSFAAPWSPYEHDSNTSALIRFRSGVVVTYVHGHDASRGEFRMALHGERGALVGRVLDRSSSTSGLERLTFTRRPEEQFGAEAEVDVPFAAQKGEAGVLEDFYGYAVNGAEPGISGYRNLEVMALCQMMVTSIQEGRTVRRGELEAPEEIGG